MAFWHDAGVPIVDATDFSEEAIARVAEDWAGRGTYRVLDVAGENSFAGVEAYPLVSCMNVLLHILDEAAFRKALANLARVIEPQGYLLLAEPVLTGGVRPQSRKNKVSKRRNLTDYTEPLSAAGIELIDIQPAAAIAGDPVEAPNRALLFALQLWWWTVLAIDKIPALRTPLVRVVEVADGLARRAGFAQTGRLLLFKRN